MPGFLQGLFFGQRLSPDHIKVINNEFTQNRALEEDIGWNDPAAGGESRQWLKNRLEQIEIGRHQRFCCYPANQ
jgi:hypothetical protein